jgi:catechol 2,3-dioxygenase-like lactoylglutathione lyase family enzyme
MPYTLARIALIVPDYDAALQFYVGTLGFRLVEDRPVPEQNKRFVVIAAPLGGAELVLARAANAHQLTRVGDQTGGRVFLFLHTENLEREVVRLTAAGVAFVREISRADFGAAAVFKDPFGNLWDLVEPMAG